MVSSAWQVHFLEGCASGPGQASLGARVSPLWIFWKAMANHKLTLPPFQATLNLPWPILHYFTIQLTKFSSVQFSCSVVSDSLRPHGLQHTRPHCPLPTPGVYSNSCPLNQLWHPTISSSVVPFSSHLQSFLASESFPINRFFTSGGHSIGVSASASVLPMNTQDWFPLGWTGWISLKSKRLSRVFSNTTVQKRQFFSAQLSL